MTIKALWKDKEDGGNLSANNHKRYWMAASFMRFGFYISLRKEKRNFVSQRSLNRGMIFVQPLVKMVSVASSFNPNLAYLSFETWSEYE